MVMWSWRFQLHTGMFSYGSFSRYLLIVSTAIKPSRFFYMLAFVLWAITSYLVISSIMRTSVAVLWIVALQLQMGSGDLAQKNISFFFM